MMRGFKQFFIDATATAHNINGIIQTNGLIMFFKKGDAIFGAPEESRLVFSKLKVPDENDTENWEDASFIAYNMQDALSGKETSRVFHAKDLNGIKIIDQKQVAKLLDKK